MLRSLIVLLLGSFTLFFLGMAWFVIGVHSADRTVDTRLAFWMEHDWASGQTVDFTKLIRQMDGLPVTDLYFHVGPIDEDGSLADDLNIPTAELNVLSTTNYAWVGQVRARIDLDNPAVQNAIVDSAGFLLSQGFDGIHLNIEPVRADDAAFFELVSALRSSYPDMKLSLSMDQWQPHNFTQFVAWLIDNSIDSYWTSAQVKRVLEDVDQLVVMTYDTKLTDGRLYTWWVEQQTVALSRHMDDSTELFIGIPSYEEGAAIDPEAENLHTGCAGYWNGVRNVRSRLQSLAGIAVYSYWEMDDDEWELLHTECAAQQ